MWVNYRIHQKTKEIEYRAYKDGRITWVKDKNDQDIIDRGTEKDAKLTKLRIMKPYDEYGYHHGELEVKTNAGTDEHLRLPPRSERKEAGIHSA